MGKGITLADPCRRLSECSLFVQRHGKAGGLAGGDRRQQPDCPCLLPRRAVRASLRSVWIRRRRPAEGLPHLSFCPPGQITLQGERDGLPIDDSPPSARCRGLRGGHRRARSEFLAAAAAPVVAWRNRREAVARAAPPLAGARASRSLDACSASQAAVGRGQVSRGTELLA
jgi:hypothetical protein